MKQRQKTIADLGYLQITVLLMVTEIEDLTANIAMLGREELDLKGNLDVGSLMVKVDVGMVTHAGLGIYKTSTIPIYLMVID